ncbi:MAG TPA: ROK family protein [Thermoplasmata archaeon]|nr:ROK family protein [Thermoplasmata archaeon]
MLAIDLGATKVASALVRADGRVERRGDRIEHANEGVDVVLARLLESARSALQGRARPPVGVGVCIAAQVDPSSGSIVYAPNLGWRDVPLASRVGSELGAPVWVANDARAAVLAEWRLGAGRGVEDVFCLSLGTGVGGGAVIDGRPARGTRNAAGEVGHLTIVAGGRRCSCPNRGCFEAYVGGWAIAQRAVEAVERAEAEGAPPIGWAAARDRLSARSVFDAARTGEPLAVRLVAETEAYLADGAVSVTNAFNPARLVLTGGLLRGRPELLRVTREAIESRCQPPAAGAEVVAARFGEDAPLVGAALTAFDGWNAPSRRPSRERPSGSS